MTDQAPSAPIMYAPQQIAYLSESVVQLGLPDGDDDSGSKKRTSDIYEDDGKKGQKVKKTRQSREFAFRYLDYWLTCVEESCDGMLFH